MIESFAPDGGYIVNETFSVTFECSATGIPAPEIQWYRDNELLTGVDPDTSSTFDPDINMRVVVNDPQVDMTMSNRGLVFLTQRTLTLNNAMGSDTGDDYRCEASNMVLPIVTETFTIIVQSMVYLGGGGRRTWWYCMCL